NSGALLLEEAARLEFMSKAHLFIAPGNMAKVKTLPCWWALMQHHGAPTRLLDWSASPYVAAYFATQQDGSTQDGAVWCFCHRRLEAAFVREYGEEPPEPVRTEDEDPRVKRLHTALRNAKAKASVVPLKFTFHSSARMAEQQGRFTMCLRVDQDHTIIATKIPPTHATKILIPHEAKPDFLAELRRMNITAAALFPGVDGLGRSIAELTSLGARHAATARKA
ncbi:MAG: FRG domain-containing protein, partial [Acidobacteriota bacterium]|nr:FRG domain-containing protein [Acidobacteriota bacterium]